MISMKKRGKFDLVFSVFIILLILSISPMISAQDGKFFSNFKKALTGKATSGADINISVGAGGNAPSVIFVYNATAEFVSGITLTEGPAFTGMRINFSVNDSDGVANLDTASLNISQAGELTYHNSTCKQIVNDGGNIANYSCLINISWYSAQGVWTINASIKDLGSNVAYGKNSTALSGESGSAGVAPTISINPLTGLISGPTNLTFAELTAGAVNSTPTGAAPLIINNTGNQDFTYGQISINASHLYGEVTSTLAIWGGNFTIANNTGSSAECNFKGDIVNGNATRLLGNTSFTNINQANLSRGNYSLNDQFTGQERLYVCLLLAGTELTQQAYSTKDQGAWLIRVL